MEERRTEIGNHAAHTALECALSTSIEQLRQSEEAAWRGVQDAERLRTHVVSALEEQLSVARACQDTTELREMVLRTVRTTSRDALCVKAVQTAVREGVDVNARTEGPTGEGWLTVAAKDGLVETARTLLAAGAEVDRADNSGWTALFATARFGHVQAMRVLLEAGAEVNRAANNGSTALHVAAQNGQVEAIRTLVEAGADPNRPSNQGLSLERDRAPSGVALEALHIEAAFEGAGQLHGTSAADHNAADAAQ